MLRLRITQGSRPNTTASAKYTTQLCGRGWWPSVSAYAGDKRLDPAGAKRVAPNTAVKAATPEIFAEDFEKEASRARVHRTFHRALGPRASGARSRPGSRSLDYKAQQQPRSTLQQYPPFTFTSASQEAHLASLACPAVGFRIPSQF